MSDTTTPTSTESWVHERYLATHLGPVMALMAAEHRTGQLILHLGEGTITAIEWKQRASRSGTKCEIPKTPIPVTHEIP